MFEVLRLQMSADQPLSDDVFPGASTDNRIAAVRQFWKEFSESTDTYNCDDAFEEGEDDEEDDGGDGGGDRADG